MARAIDAEKLKVVLTGSFKVAGIIAEQYKPVFDAITKEVEKVIDEQPTIDTVKHEWISVKDRLPEAGADVICVTIADTMDVYIWTGEGWMDSYGNCEDDDIISHWMPLPEPPEMDGE